MTKFKIGSRVKVTSINPNDEGNPDFLGKSGEIFKFLYGCGNSDNPDDPLYCVDFGVDGTESYWAEELTLDN